MFSQLRNDLLLRHDSLLLPDFVSKPLGSVFFLEIFSVKYFFFKSGTIGLSPKLTDAGQYIKRQMINIYHPSWQI